MPIHLSRREFERIVREALESLPPEFRRYTRGMEIRVEDYPDDASMAEWGTSPPDYPFGCYEGPALPEVDGTRLDFGGVMRVFKRPLEQWCQDEKELRDQIERTFYHELGHRLGFEEEDMPGMLQPGAGMEPPEDFAAEAGRRAEQARADLAAAQLLLEKGSSDWALTVALSAASLGLQVFLLRRGLDPGEFSTSSLSHLVLRCEDFDKEFAAFRNLDPLERISTDLGDEEMSPPCRRVHKADAKEALRAAEKILGMI
jgi:predicted Zn-dependent protease with MMP-like domain/HEPN domain-containing protein